MRRVMHKYGLLARVRCKRQYYQYGEGSLNAVYDTLQVKVKNLCVYKEKRVFSIAEYRNVVLHCVLQTITHVN